MQDAGNTNMRIVPKESKIVKNAKVLANNKKDMRRKLVKSNTKWSDLKRPITKRQNGGLASFIEVYDKPVSITPTEFSEYNLPISDTYIEHKKKLEKPEKEEKSEPIKQVIEPPKVSTSYKKASNDFINTVRPIIHDTLVNKGLDPKWTNYLVSQVALESGWGKHESGKFNLSGIKGKGSTKNTKEFINGKMTNIKDSFRDYKDYKDWAEDYINLLTNSRYGKAFSLSESEFMPYIIKQGYATDPNYVNKYNKVLEKINKMQGGGIISKEYRDAYNKGNITRKVGDTYVAKDLDEVTVKPTDYNPIGQSVSKTLHTVGNGISKAAMSVTPYSPVMAGMELGASFVPGSTNYGDTKNAAINAGLEVLPYGLMAGLGKLGKFLSKTPKVIRSKQAIATATNDASHNLMARQNFAFLDGMNKFDTSVYGGEVKHTLNRSGDAMITINPDIKRRMAMSGLSQKPYKYIDQTGSLVNPKSGLVDNVNDTFHFGEPVASFNTDIAKNTSNAAGKTDYRGNITLYRGQGNKYFSPSDIKDTAAHESLHRFQSYTGTTLDKPSKGYYAANDANPVAKTLKPYLAEDSWAQSADEVWADLWSYRVRNNIGSRDLTDNEAMDAVMQLARHWDMSKFSSEAINKLKKALQTLPVVGVPYLGINMSTQNESQIH